MSLPQLISAPLEIAGSGLSKMKAEVIQHHGWIIKDAQKVTFSYDSFCNYLLGSKAEFSVCKNVYVATSSGWFSDKSAAYMASGKPVVVQDTGFKKHLPVGEGLFAVTNVDEAKDAIMEIEGNYSFHSQKAWEIAGEYLEASKVLKKYFLVNLVYKGVEYMSKKMIVSIIINNYNYGRFLRQAIDSALDQSYPNVEIIVDDDGSTDSSQNIIAAYSNTIIPILKENGGQASAFNIGFKLCRGEIVVFLDSDDVLLPTAVEEAVQVFGPQVVEVHWQMWRVNESGEKTGGVVPQFPLIDGDIRESLVKHGPDHCGGPPYSPPTSGNAWSRQFLEQVLPMPETEFKLGADHYLFTLAPIFGELRSLSQPQGCYRVHGNNDTLKPLELYISEFFARYEYCCGTLSRLLQDKGIDVNPVMWTRNSWFHQLHAVMQESADVVPPAATFILVDEDLWGANGIMNGRHRIPFLELNGQYWGKPANDSAAIQEIKRQRKKGASFMIFAWPAFWWLNFYAGMHDYLKRNSECVLLNDRLVIFNLQRKRSAGKANNVKNNKLLVTKNLYDKKVQQTSIK